MIFQALSLFLFFVFSYTDLKTREVPDRLVYLFLLLSIFALPDLKTIVFATFIAGSLYLLGAWALGDALIFLATSLSNPYSAGFLPFPVIFLTTSVFSALPLFFLKLFPKIEHKKEILLRALESTGLVAAFLATPFPLSLVLVPISFFLPKVGLICLPLVIFQPFALLTGILVLFLETYFRGKRLLKKKKKVEELEEGDVPAEWIWVENGRIGFGWPPKGEIVANPTRADGFTKEEIKKLKELGVEEVWVKETTAFVPQLFIGYFLALLWILFF